MKTNQFPQKVRRARWLPALFLILCAPVLMGPIYRVHTGLEPLINESDAVAVVRVEPRQFTPTAADPIDHMWTVGEGVVTAEVLGSLKGDLQADTTVTIKLRVLPAPGLPSPWNQPGTRGLQPGAYLMFLKQGGRYAGQQVDWEAVNTEGNVLVMPGGSKRYTTEPGESTEQAVRRLLGDTSSSRRGDRESTPSYQIWTGSRVKQ